MISHASWKAYSQYCSDDAGDLEQDAWAEREIDYFTTAFECLDLRIGLGLRWFIKVALWFPSHEVGNTQISGDGCLATQLLLTTSAPRSLPPQSLLNRMNMVLPYSTTTDPLSLTCLWPSK
jgi:hypothetical protein